METDGLLFDTRDAAIEQAERWHTLGYNTKPITKTTDGKYRVVRISGLKDVSEKEVKEQEEITPGEIIAEEEKKVREERLRSGVREKYAVSDATRQAQIEAEKKKALKGFSRMSPKEIQEEEKQRIKDEKIRIGIRKPQWSQVAPQTQEFSTNVLSHASRGMHVKGGMKSAIPGTSGRHPRILQDYSQARIAHISSPKIAEYGNKEEKPRPRIIGMTRINSNPRSKI